MKRISELAKEIGVSKSTLQRHINKNHQNDIVYQEYRNQKTIFVDEALEQKLRAHFLGTEADETVEAERDTVNDAVMIALMTQLKEKDEQIRKLQQMLENQQKLTAQAQLALTHKEEEQPKEQYERVWWKFYKRVR